MKGYKRIDPKEIGESPIKFIGEDWMLIGAGDESSSNAMTASWGTIGYYANSPMVTVFVRPERYTNDLLKRHSHFTLTVLDSAHKGAHMTFGKLSGRDHDKASLAGLTPMLTPLKNPTFQQGRLIIECRKIFAQTMSEESYVDKELYNKWYGAKDAGEHILYMGEIINCWTLE